MLQQTRGTVGGCRVPGQAPLTAAAMSAAAAAAAAAARACSVGGSGGRETEQQRVIAKVSKVILNTAATGVTGCCYVWVHTCRLFSACSGPYSSRQCHQCLSSTAMCSTALVCCYLIPHVVGYLICMLHYCLVYTRNLLQAASPACSSLYGSPAAQCRRSSSYWEPVQCCSSGNQCSAAAAGTSAVLRVRPSEELPQWRALACPGGPVIVHMYAAGDNEERYGLQVISFLLDAAVMCRGWLGAGCI
jgi:hypothetical protein